MAIKKQKKYLFTVKVENWEKFNTNKKSYHTMAMVSVGFLRDEVVSQLSQVEVILYLYYILRSAEIGTSYVQVTPEILSSYCRSKPSLIPSYILNLQSLGLLTVTEGHELFETVPLRREEKRKEEKRRDEIGAEVENSEELFGTEQALPSPVLEYPTDLLLFKSVFIERKVKPKTVQSWLENFNEPDWIGSELKKALVWESGNPRRKKKDFGRFFSGWLVRAWDSRRTNNDRTASGREARNINALQEALARK